MNKTQEVAYFERVCDLYDALDLPIAQDSEFSVDCLLDIHSTIPYKSPVFRTNYYSFIFVRDGRGNYTTDELKFEYDKPTIYFTNPGHLKAFEFLELKNAYLITFSEEFLRLNVHGNIFDEFPFLLSETIPPQHPDVKSFDEIETLYLQILTENNGSSKFKNKIIANFLVVLLTKIKELFWDNYYPLEEGTSNSKIVKTFRENLEQHYRRLLHKEADVILQTQDYAKFQNLNPSYFSQVIKSKTGKSPSQWIAEKTIAYAKASLLNSPKSIKEMAFEMGFSDVAHFSNFFKKNEGVSPSFYRKSNPT